MINGQMLNEIRRLYPEINLVFSYREWQTDFLRFYHSQINYNITKSSTTISVTMEKTKKKMSFTIQNPTKESIIKMIDENKTFIDMVPQDSEFVDFDDDAGKAEMEKKPNNIELIPLEKKIEILKKISEDAKQYDFDIFGTFLCNYQKVLYQSDKGVEKVHEQSPIMLDIKAVSNKNEVTIIEKYGSEDFSSFDLDLFLNRFNEKIKTATEDVVDVDPGNYVAILSPYATAEFVSYLLYNAHAAMLYSKQSFFMDKKGQKMFPESINICDDPFEKGLISSPYGAEWHLLKKLPIIEKGVFKNFMVDNYYGKILGLDVNGTEGSNIVMTVGNDELDEMIKSVKNGLYISNIHYMNFINFTETSVTGLTRDGTFLIKDGKLSKVVNNLRFTLKISELLENVTMIENKSYTVPESSNYGYFEVSAVKMPHIKTEKFHISSSTKTI